MKKTGNKVALRDIEERLAELTSRLEVVEERLATANKLLEAAERVCDVVLARESLHELRERAADYERLHVLLECQGRIERRTPDLRGALMSDLAWNSPNRRSFA